MNLDQLLFFNALTSSMLFVLIWLVQILIYPNYVWIREDDFISFEKRHIKNISFFVAPLVFLDMSFSTFILYQSQNDPSFVGLHFAITSFFLSIVPLVITFFYFVKIHDALSKKLDPSKICALIKYNWFRTILWTFNFLIAVWGYLMYSS